MCFQYSWNVTVYHAYSPSNINLFQLGSKLYSTIQLPHRSSKCFSVCNTFYYQCFPIGSINFGFSCLAAQWLSQKPCNLTKAILHCLSEVQDERSEFSKQAEKDWQLFLLMRARELSKGKQTTELNGVQIFKCSRTVITMITQLRSSHSFFFLFFCFKEGNTFSYSPLYIAIQKAWEVMAKDNIITEVT